MTQALTYLVYSDGFLCASNICIQDGELLSISAQPLKAPNMSVHSIYQEQSNTLVAPKEAIQHKLPTAKSEGFAARGEPEGGTPSSIAGFSCGFRSEMKRCKTESGDVQATERYPRRRSATNRRTKPQMNRT